MRKTSQEEAEGEGQTLNQRAGGKSGEFGITGVSTGTRTEVTVCVMGQEQTLPYIYIRH